MCRWGWSWVENAVGAGAQHRAGLAGSDQQGGVQHGWGSFHARLPQRRQSSSRPTRRVCRTEGPAAPLQVNTPHDATSTREKQFCKRGGGSEGCAHCAEAAASSGCQTQVVAQWKCGSGVRVRGRSACDASQ
eukprot:5272171-Prymnesium_polylepis.1